MLTSYPEKELEGYIKRNNWKQISKTSRVFASKSANGKRNKTKVEIITMNYSANNFF